MSKVINQEVERVNIQHKHVLPHQAMPLDFTYIQQDRAWTGS